MILADSTIPDGMHFDCCVVGGGPVGISLALELAASGERVLLLESGGLARDPQAQALSDATFTDPKAHDPMSIAVARRLGGTSNLWGGRCVPYDPIDFAPRPGVCDALWPIGLNDIAPYYPAACRYANCGEPVFSCPIPSLSVCDERFSHATLERWSTKPRFQRSHRAALRSNANIHVALHATVVDLDIANASRVRAVIVARPDGSRTRIPVRCLVLAAGGIETARLLLSVQRRIPRAFGGIDGPLGRYYMGHVIGEIADITFATERIDAAYDFFIDGHGSYVRRRFVPSESLQLAERLTNVALWPVVPVSADPRHRSGALSLVALVMSVGPLGRLLVAEAVRQRHMPHGMKRLPHLRNVLLDVPPAAAFAARTMFRRYLASLHHPACYLRNGEMRYGLAYHAEQLPNPDSRIRLTGERDRFGLPRVQIDLRFLDEDVRAVVRTHELFADWLRSSRFGRLEYRQSPEQNAAAVRALAHHGTHQIGLVRMARRPEDGVVDGNLRCFGFDNLYIAGTGVLPTSSQAAPTLTALALAVRLARHLVSAAARSQLPLPRSTTPTPTTRAVTPVAAAATTG